MTRTAVDPIEEEHHQTLATPNIPKNPEPFQDQQEMEHGVVDGMDSTYVRLATNIAAVCPSGTYYAAEPDSCLPCPSFAEHNFTVFFSDPARSFEGVGGVLELQLGRIVLVNWNDFSVSVVPVSIPSWVKFVGGVWYVGDDVGDPLGLEVGSLPIIIAAKGNLPLEFQVNFSTLQAGNTTSHISFGVSGDSSYSGCHGPNATLLLEVEASPPELNHIGGLLGVGWFMLGVVSFSCLFFIAWVRRNRRVRVVKSMQPLFLTAICVGVFVVGLSILAVNISDENASEQAADIWCMARPWFLIMGFTLIFSALFSKLWRINKLFHGSRRCRKLSVTERDVLGPFLVLFLLNFTLLLVRTIVDPNQFERIEIDDNPGNTMVTCSGQGNVGESLAFLSGVVTCIAFILTCIQAYRARKISDEFSESKNLGTALFIWVQILAIGVPVLFLVGVESPTTSYFVMISMIFGLCMSMLLALFLPIYIHYRRLKREGMLHSNAPSNRNVRVTGTLEKTPRMSHSESVAAAADKDVQEPNHETKDGEVCQLKARIRELESRNRELERVIAKSKEKKEEVEFIGYPAQEANVG